MTKMIPVDKTINPDLFVLSRVVEFDVIDIYYIRTRFAEINWYNNNKVFNNNDNNNNDNNNNNNASYLEV